MSWWWSPQAPQQHCTLPCMLVDISAVLFSRQISWLSSSLALSLAHYGWWVAEWTPPTQSAQLGCAATPLSPLTQQGFAELSLLWLSKGCWVWLPLPRHRLLPSTQQGFAEPLLQVSFNQLSKGLLSRSYYCMTQGTALSQNIHSMYTTGVTQCYSDWASYTSSARICWAYPGP